MVTLYYLVSHWNKSINGSGKNDGKKCIIDTQTLNRKVKWNQSTLEIHGEYKFYVGLC